MKNNDTETVQYVSLDTLADHVQKNFERITCEKNCRLSRRTGVSTYEIKCNEYQCGFRVSEDGTIDIFARDRKIKRMMCIALVRVDDLIKEHNGEIDMMTIVYVGLSLFLDVMDRLFYEAEDALMNQETFMFYT